jgi:hypothetical protein
MAVNVIDCLIHVADNVNGHDEIQKFMPEVGLHVQVYSSAFQSTEELLSSREVPVDDQRFRGVAYRRVLSLGIHGDSHRFFGVGGRVDVHVTDSIRMAKHRNSSAVLDALDHLIRPARNDEADKVIHREKLGYFLSSRD